MRQRLLDLPGSDFPRIRKVLVSGIEAAAPTNPRRW
jgi:hypothetical protein